MNRRNIRQHVGSMLAAVPGVGAKAVELRLRRKYGDGVVTPAKVRNFIRARRDRLTRAGRRRTV